ncbi:MATE family efflux transporter [Chloroflexota bacterium]
MEQEVGDVGGRGGRGGRGSRFDKDWTKGSILGNLLTLSWPIIITDIIRTIGPTFDMIWVGRLGPAAIAGVGIGGSVVMFLTVAKNCLNVGSRALIARFVGAGDEEMANLAAQQAFVVSTIYALLVTAVGIFFVEALLAPFGLEADVVRDGAAYMRIMFLTQAIRAFLMLAESIMQASGDTVTPMKINVAAELIHAPLAPFLIFGWWVFPYMGVQGAAMANLIGYGIGTSFGLWYLFTGRTRLRVTFRNFRFDLNMIWRIVKIGIPASIAGVERTLARLLVLKFVSPFGTLAVAAYSMTERVERLLHMPSAALGRAGGVLVGQNLGAGQPQRAEKSGWSAGGVGTVIMVACSVPILIWPESIARIFSSDPDLIRIASVFLRIETAGYLGHGLYHGLQQSIMGAGDTMPPMLITLLMMWGVQLPLAFFLPKVAELGVYGIPLAIAISVVIGAAAYTTYFKSGRWKRKQV